MTIEEIDDALDVLMLRRAKMEMLVTRLRTVHLKLTRRRRYMPVIKQGDSALESKPYAPHHERAAWQAKPKSKTRKQPYDETNKTLWRNAKRGW